MGPNKLGRDFKTIKIQCVEGHKVAQYRKPKSEWGHRTHKLWLVEERLGKLTTEPPILVEDNGGERRLNIPETGTPIYCGAEGCDLEVGEIALIKGTVALELNKSNIKPTKG